MLSDHILILLFPVYSAHYCSAEDKQMYQEWVKTMDPIHNNIHNFRRVCFHSMFIRYGSFIE